MQHYTTIAQSKKLVELGLNPETADMYYFYDPTPAGNAMYPTLIIIEKHLHSRLPEYDKGDISVGLTVLVISMDLAMNLVETQENND